MGLTYAFTAEGTCPTNIAAFQNAEAERMTGKWYPIYVDASETKKMGFDPACTQAIVELAEDSMY